MSGLAKARAFLVKHAEIRARLSGLTMEAELQGMVGKVQFGRRHRRRYIKAAAELKRLLQKENA